MAAARFQVFSKCSDLLHDHAPSCPVMWRFLSANNRSIGRSVGEFPDGDTCLEALRDLQKQVRSSLVFTARDDLGLWVWRLRIDRMDVAKSTRCYQRRLHAENAGAAFRDLAETVQDIDALRVVCF